LNYLTYIGFNGFLNPSSDNVMCTAHNGDVTCSACSASYRKNSLKMASVVLKEEKICYKNLLQN